MKRLFVTAAVGLLALMAVAGPVSARTFGAVYANDQIYRVFGNAANVPDGTGTDPFATFTNSTNADQKGVAEFAPGSPTGHHGGRWAVHRPRIGVAREATPLAVRLHERGMLGAFRHCCWGAEQGRVGEQGRR